MSIMSMYTERLQILIDPDRRARLDQIAASRGTSIAVLVREAIDAQFPDDQQERRRAGEAILALEPIDLPSPEELRRELDDAHARGL